MGNLNVRILTMDIKSPYTASGVYTKVLVAASDESVRQLQKYHYFLSWDS